MYSKTYWPAGGGRGQNSQLLALLAQLSTIGTIGSPLLAGSPGDHGAFQKDPRAQTGWFSQL